jgi:hypothetical protein
MNGGCPRSSAVHGPVKHLVNPVFIVALLLSLFVVCGEGPWRVLYPCI